MSQALDRLTLGPIQNPVRGLLHGTAALLSLALGLQLFTTASSPGGVRTAVLVFAFSQWALYTASSLYHSVPWDPHWKRRMQRIDHAMIYLKIAGAVTPLALVSLEGWPLGATLGSIWTIAALGVGQKALLPDVPERASIPVQIAQACFSVPVLAAFAERYPGTPVTLALVGALVYGVGALVFLTERPRLWPRIFSFHELFHVLVVTGSALHFALLAETLSRL